jgi:hypothetical protein
MVAGGTRNACPMRAASRPSTVWSMSGVCREGSIAGCAQTKSSSARRSGKVSPATAVAAVSAARWRSVPSCSCCTRVRRDWSINRCRATVSSHASGCRGTPSFGQEVSAASSDSLSASSAPATSRVLEERYASRRPYDARATDSTVRRASSTRSAFHECGVKVDVYRPHLDRPGRRRGAAGGPLERCVEGRDVEDDEAAELLSANGPS